jgi:hypothetical protein
MKRAFVPVVAIALVVAIVVPAAQTFDQTYAAYGALLARHVEGARVDYQGLAADRERLDAIISDFARVAPSTEQQWDAHERLAFWINTYNLLTLHAVAARYPIKGGLLSRYPRNSIRQIDGVWTELTWKAAGRDITLDGIEHGIIRKEFRQPLIHFALNCASVSCPPLRAEPYVASTLVQQLEDATRLYLAGREGARVDGRTLRASSIFKWYGEDFVQHRTPLRPIDRREIEGAVRAVLRKYGPPDVAALAADTNVRLAYIAYDWSLNDLK